MEHQLKPLPYPTDALAPHCSKETLEYHHGKHQKAYVDNLNALQKGGEFESMPLEEIVKKASGSIYNNAAQIANHDVFWQCMKPNGGGQPTGALLQAINQKWGSYEAFREAVIKTGVGNFGSGWVWLVQKPDNTLDLVAMGPAGNPMTTQDKGLMGIDVWEHTYYIDYRNDRKKFLEVFMDKLVNWDFVATRLA